MSVAIVTVAKLTALIGISEVIKFDCEISTVGLEYRSRKLEVNNYIEVELVHFARGLSFWQQLLIVSHILLYVYNLIFVQIWPSCSNIIGTKFCIELSNSLIYKIKESRRLILINIRL